MWDYNDIIYENMSNFIDHFQLNMERTPEKASKQRLDSINQAEDHKWKKEMVFVVKHSCS